MAHEVARGVELGASTSPSPAPSPRWRPFQLCRRRPRTVVPWRALWGAPAIEPVTLAQMSQRTENNYYGKPCGLMDQAAVCLGGLACMDFEDQAQPKTQKLEL